MNIADMHCDTISRIYQERKQGKKAALRSNLFQLDLEKMKKSGYLLQNFAVFVDFQATDMPFEDCLGQIALFQEEMEKNMDLISPVTSYHEILENQQQGKISALLTLEEGGLCRGSLEQLHQFHNLGIRMMTFTWNYPNSLGNPAQDNSLGYAAQNNYPNNPAPSSCPEIPTQNGRSKKSAPSNHSEIPTPSSCSKKSALSSHLKTHLQSSRHHGLTSLGMEFLEEMEHLGIIPDVSHLSDAGMLDVCRLAKKPFCASHSNARSLCPHPRNLPDGLIRSIGAHGGMIGANYYGPFLSHFPDSLGRYYSYAMQIASHIRHISNIGGISCIGLGSDFDGIDNYLEISDCSNLGLLEHALRKEGFHESEIEKIFYKNVLEFYRELL